MSKTTLHFKFRNISRAAIAVIAAMLASSAHAAFHLWNFNEIYTDSSGTLQFIELFTSASSQTFIGGQQITVANVGNTLSHTFTIPGNLSSDSANKYLLLGTAGLQAAGGPAPDYIIPNNFLFAAGGTLTGFSGFFGGAYTALPTDGINSRTWGDGNAVNSPANFAGQTGTVVVPEPSAWALMGMAGISFGLLRRRLSA